MPAEERALSIVQADTTLEVFTRYGFEVGFAGESAAAKQALQCRLTELRRELAGPCPTPLERLLVEDIVACWLQVQHADATASRLAAERDQELQNPALHPASEFLQRRQDRAHRRFLSAVKALALVRRLELPALQVNIGEKQVNIGEQQVNVGTDP